MTPVIFYPQIRKRQVISICNSTLCRRMVFWLWTWKRTTWGINKKKQKESLLTSGSSGKMLSTSLLYRGLSAPQQPQTPEEGENGEEKQKQERSAQLGLCSMTDRNTINQVFFLFSFSGSSISLHSVSQSNEVVSNQPHFGTDSMNTATNGQ